MKPILKRYLLTIFYFYGTKVEKNSCHCYQKSSPNFLFHHVSGRSYLPLHTNFPALCLILQGKICTFLTKLKTHAVTNKSRWLDKIFFRTHPETLQWIAHIMWYKYIHTIFFLVCLEPRKSKCLMHYWSNLYTFLLLQTARQMCPL